MSILGPFHYFLPLSFLWAFPKSFRLLWPNYHILCLWVYWPLNQSHLPIPFFGLFQPIFAFFLFLMIPMGLLLHSLGLPQPVCFLWGHLLFYGPMNHYSCHSGSMVFTLLLSFFAFFILLGFFCHWSILSKKGHQHNSRPTKYQRYMLPSIRFDSQLLHSTHSSFFIYGYCNTGSSEFSLVCII